MTDDGEVPAAPQEAAAHMLDARDFAALVDNLPVSAWIADAEGSITWYNRRWYDYSGTSPAEMAGWGWQSVHDPAKLPEVLERWRHSIATGAPFEMVFPLRGADGVFRPFLTRVRPVLNDDGLVTRWIGSNTEITSELAVNVAEAQRLRAELASQAKTDFLASMSHEIRTPLNGILGYTDLLLRGGNGAAEQRRMISRIQSAGEALLTVVNDILDFSKIEAGQIELELQPFALSAMVDSCRSIVSGIAKQKGIALSVEMADELPIMVLGDRDRLRQILLNLLNNAIKFTAQGSVRLSVTRGGAGPDAAGDAIRFVVQDTGIGIAQDKRERLFQRFSQIDGSISRDFGGTGLGLAISKRLAELMRGTIGVDSRIGEGSAFWLDVPLPAVECSASVAAVEPDEADEIDAAYAGRILVVEDVEINQEICRRILEAAGHRVDVVSDGVAAISAVRDSAYDLVLMDIQMPGMDGLQATRHIREIGGELADLPILALTANVLPHQVAAFQQGGMDGHIGKPFKRRELLSTVTRILAERSARQAASA